MKLVVARPIWRCVRRRVDLTRVFDMLEGGGEPAELHCSIESKNLTVEQVSICMLKSTCFSSIHFDLSKDQIAIDTPVGTSKILMLQ